MSNPIRDYITDCEKVEAALRDFASGEYFGPPPEGLVERAMSRTTRRCAPLSSSRPVIVLSLAAIALIVALAHTDGKRDNGMRFTADLRPVESVVSSAPVGTINAATLPQMPERAANRQLVVHEPGLNSTTDRAGGRGHAGNMSGRKPVWTNTVVTSTEQGVLIPVSSQGQGIPGEQNSQTESEVAVVPIHSTVSYTEYTGDAAP